MFKLLLLVALSQTPTCPCAQTQVQMNANRSEQNEKAIASINDHLEQIEEHTHNNTVRLAKYDERSNVLWTLISLVVSSSLVFQIIAHRRDKTKGR